MSARVRLLALCTVVLLAALAYLNTLDNEFVYDDGAQILRNYYIRDLTHLKAILTTNVWSFLGPHAVSNYYRPVMHLVYMADYALFGYDPAGYHGTNVFFHAMNAALVLLVCEALALPAFVAVGAAVLFALHPINTEAVTWVAGIPELTYTFFFLLSLLCYVKARPVQGEGTARYSVWLGFSFAAAILALFSKETALMLAPAIMIYEHAIRRSDESHLLRWRFYAGHWAAVAFYIAARIYSLGGFQVATNPYGVMPAWQFVLSVVYLTGKYIATLFVPAPFNIFHVFRPASGLTDWRFLAGLAAVAATAAAAYLLWRRQRVLLLAFALMLLPLVPVLNMRAIGHNVFAERYLYLPAAGFALLLAWTLHWLAQRRPTTALVLLAVLALNYGALAAFRNRDWHDDVMLYTVTLQVSPESNLIRDNLGKTFLDGFGRPDLAEQCFRECVRRAPDRAEYRYGLGLALAELRRYDEAVSEVNRALELWPKYPEALHAMGDIYREQGRTDDAARQYRRALEIKPTYAEVMVAMGSLEREQGRLGEAERHFRGALKIMDFPDAHVNLGLLWLEQNRATEAEQAFRNALVSEPHSVNAWYGLARALRAQRRAAEAENAYRSALNERHYTRVRRLGRTPLPDEATIRRELDGMA